MTYKNVEIYFSPKKIFSPPYCIVYDDRKHIGFLQICAESRTQSHQKNEVIMGKIVENYGELVFNKKEMAKRLSPSTFKKLIQTIEHGDALDESIATEVAHGMKEWALENGATHFTHWFQPQRSGTAEKHDAFLSYDSNGDPIEKFTASQLIQSEPDASSFPSGGIRSTFEARGYTAWDPNSPAFLRDTGAERSLVIPSIFVSWTGEALDMKTPLLRSINALNTHAIQLQKLLGNRAAKRITVYSGMEQEYFLVPEELAELRPDLVNCGRTLFGAAPAKGQTMEDHYFGAIRPAVMDFMNSLDRELFRYGIPAKTKHNEVAPNQFELAPLYEEIALAIDHNLLVMDVMERVATEHGFKVLLHEKPFKGLNGSGKHMNWSLGDNSGTNYLEPSKSPVKNITFLMTLAALFLGVKQYSGVLRNTLADAGNEHRLGSHEAPPSLLSVYMGDYLAEILDHIAAAKQINAKEMSYINSGLSNMPRVAKDISDRNRTSPIAFTGNKFELRAVGSSANGCDAATALNVLCAYGYKTIVERLSKMKGDAKSNAFVLLKDILKETKDIRFEGNGYSEEWKTEAIKKRKLYFVETVPEAYQYMLGKEAANLYSSLKVLTPRELASRIEVKFTSYSHVKSLELEVASRLVKTEILPSLEIQMSQTGAALSAVQAAKVASPSLIGTIKKLEDAYSAIVKADAALDAFVAKNNKVSDSYKHAYALATTGQNLLAELREVVDAAELIVAGDIWPIPTYDQLLAPM